MGCILGVVNIWQMDPLCKNASPVAARTDHNKSRPHTHSPYIWPAQQTYFPSAINLETCKSRCRVDRYTMRYPEGLQGAGKSLRCGSPPNINWLIFYFVCGHCLCTQEIQNLRQGPPSAPFYSFLSLPCLCAHDSPLILNFYTWRATRAYTQQTFGWRKAIPTSPFGRRVCFKGSRLGIFSSAFFNKFCFFYGHWS